MRVSHNQTNGYLAARRQEETGGRQNESAAKRRWVRSLCLEREKCGLSGDNSKHHWVSTTQACRQTVLNTHKHTHLQMRQKETE